MKKNWTTMVLSSLLLTAPLTACGSDSKPAEVNASPSAKNGKTTVTVSVLKKDAFLQEAERLFEEANPDIDIDIRAYIATPASENKQMNIKRPGGDKTNEADLEKYRTGVNAELMSGKGADLIALESLPYDKYADKKLLSNLDDLIKKDSGFQTSGYYTGVFDAVKIGGKTYALPVHFKTNITLGNAPLLTEKGIKIDDSKWTWKEMLDIGRQAVQAGGSATAVWTGKPKTDLISDIVQSQYSQYVAGKKATFDTKEFTDLLEQIGDMYDKGLILEQADMSDAGKNVFNTMSMQTPMEMLFMPQMMYGGKGKVYSTPSDGGSSGGISFSSDLMFGINEKSKNKTEAWKFLSFILSENVQSKPAMQGFAVHKASLEKQLRQSIEQLTSGRLKISGPNGASPSAAISEEQLKSILDLVEKTDSFAAGDPNVMKIVKEESQSFFTKGKTAKDAASMIQNRVTTYLNE
ncbi:ABC transporter substrate-binding protein [Paenibacillus sedimenti]|uniref:Carbohydrate ABC transporter substrate-binding protein n=1 Tax=Paenibacillus sedimenti TaxID=2770274 RepID=A0A926KMP8_9BACL|nr:ABC transporter substrate-binding protein [Paenibacillus sedimenti]MBD0379953.1 carbohydrate ABC transporter substrate-binding protein [Paenibacillus sedimenti]